MNCMNEDATLERRVWPPLHCRLLDHCDASMNTSLSATESLGSPLYEQVKQAVLAALAQGEWKQGDAIPPENSWPSASACRSARCARPSTNWRREHPGAPPGTRHLCAHTRNHHFFKFFRILRQDGHKAIRSPSCCVSGACAPRPPRAKAGAAGRRAGVRVREPAVAQRRRGDDGRDLPARITLSRPDGSASARTAQHAVRAVPGRVRGECHRHRRTAARGLADRAQARWLGVQEGEPLLEIRRVAYSYNRQPVEWRISRVNTAAYEYLGNQPWGRSPQRLPQGRRYGPAEPDPCGLDLGGRAAMRRVSSVWRPAGWGGSCARDENASVGWMRWRLGQCRAAASKPLASSARMLRHYLIRRRFA